MKPLFIILAAGGIIWAIKSNQPQAQLILPQTQTGIGVVGQGPTPQQPAQYYAGLVTPPGASRYGGYVPAFGPYASEIAPGQLYFNQA